MYLNHFVGFRCPRQLYIKFKEFIKDKEEIEDLSHGIRVSMIKFMREYHKEKTL